MRWARGHRDQHREVEEELGDLGDERLEVDRRPLRVDADGEVVGHQLADVLPDLLEVRDPRGEHVIVGDEEVAFVLVLEADADSQVCRNGCPGESSSPSADRR